MLHTKELIIQPEEGDGKKGRLEERVGAEEKDEEKGEEISGGKRREERKSGMRRNQKSIQHHILPRTVNHTLE